MIGAGLMLLAVGGLDLARKRLSGARLGVVLVILGAALLPLAAWAGAAAWWFAAIAVAAGWAAVTSTREPTRWGLWPAALLAVVVAVAVALIGVRDGQGPLERIWPIDSPLGVVSLDLAIALAGALVFLVESGNVIVRASLRGAPPCSRRRASSASPRSRATTTGETAPSTSSSEAWSAGSSRSVRLSSSGGAPPPERRR
ncbi:MAG: hypothetical protein K0S49_2832 [Microbacterium sp.]|nr:hypothetical protein [Microbacterium sp.]